MIFDPIALDEHKFMKFRKRMTQADILERLQKQLNLKVQKEILNNNSG